MFRPASFAGAGEREVEVEPYCWRDPEPGRRGEPAGETLSDPERRRRGVEGHPLLPLPTTDNQQLTTDDC